MKEKVCVVTGAGPGTGASLARRFSQGGYRVARLARTEKRLHELEKAIPGTRGYPTDVTDEEAVRDTFGRIRSDLGSVDVLLHNAGSGAFAPFLEVTPELFEASWRTNAHALLLLMRHVVPDMLDAARGTILVTGATASWRGGPNTAAFAAAKAAQRSLAQSAARSLGPKGIHVAYVIVDGVIDMPMTRTFFRDQPDEFFLKPDAIAETFYYIAHQDRSAWTFEADIRPFIEKW
jgi:NAD(P)-dependent dehydrogenase (short-subunit alcohol dehydrogenase family)